MTSDFRRHWQVALAILLICVPPACSGRSCKPPTKPPRRRAKPKSQAIADRLDTLVEQATAQVGKPGVQGGEPGTDVDALRQQLDAAEAQIALLKNVVIQALRAQSAAEEALRQEQATPRAGPGPEDGPGPTGAPEPTLAKQLEALTGRVERLQADVDALHGRAPDEHVAQDAGAAMDKIAFRRCHHRGGLGHCHRRERTRTRCCRGRAWAANTSP